MKIKNFNKKGVHFGIVLSAIGMIILVFLAGLWFGSLKEEPVSYEEVAEAEPELEIIGLKICDYVEEGYNCERGEDLNFKVGDKAVIYFEVWGFGIKGENGNVRVSLKEDFKLLGSNGDIIPNFDLFNLLVIDEEVNPDLQFIPVTNQIDLNILRQEDLVIEILVEDYLSGKTTMARKKISLSYS